MRNNILCRKKLSDIDSDLAVAYTCSQWLEQQVNRLTFTRYSVNFYDYIQTSCIELWKELETRKIKQLLWERSLINDYIPEVYQSSDYVFTICNVLGELTVWAYDSFERIDNVAFDVRGYVALLSEIRKCMFEVNFAIDDLCFAIDRNKLESIQNLWYFAEEKVCAHIFTMEKLVDFVDPRYPLDHYVWSVDTYDGIARVSSASGGVRRICI